MVLTISLIMINLTTDLTTGPPGTVDVNVCCTGAYGREQLAKLARVYPLRPRSSRRRNIWTNVGRRDRPGNGCRRRGAWLGSHRSIAKIRAEEHRDATVYSRLTQVNVGLLDSTFELRVAQ